MRVSGYVAKGKARSEKKSVSTELAYLAGIHDLCQRLTLKGVIAPHSEKSDKQNAFFSGAPQRQLTNFEVKDVHNYIGFAIQENNVSPNQHVCAIGRWRR